MESPQILLRFNTERQALAMMDHPNIAKVLDAGTTMAGQPYFVMEFVNGIPITEYGDVHMLSIEDRLHLFITVCNAIQHAHQKGIIHRDLKPSNILVTEQDNRAGPKVIDFGVAKAMGHSIPDQSNYSFIGLLVGTLEYMSPEQASLDQHDIDTRTDVYSLGVLLYELLTGSTPHLKSKLKETAIDDALRIIREIDPPKPSTRLQGPSPLICSIAEHRNIEHGHLVKTVRGELDWIVMKALEKDRSRRYESASALGADVQRYLNDESVLACPPSRLYRLGKTIRRYRGTVLAVSLILLTLIAGVVLSTLGLLRATYAESAAISEVKQKEIALGEKEMALAAAQKSENAAKEQLFESLVNQARSRRFSRQMGQRLGSLDAVTQAAAIQHDDRLRDEAIAAMALPDIRPGLTWNMIQDGFSCWTFDGNYRIYGSVCNDKPIIQIRTVAEDREIRSIHLTNSGKVLFIALSPNSNHLVSIESGGKLRLWRISDGKELIGKLAERTTRIVFSPDSRYLIAVVKGWLIRINVETGQEMNRWELPEQADVFSLAYHPDNQRVAVGYTEMNFVSIFESASGEMIVRLPLSEKGQKCVAWHDDGKRLAIGQAENIQIWDVNSKNSLITLQGHTRDGHTRQVASLAFHPKADLLASLSWDGELRLWDTSTGRLHMRLPFLVQMQVSRDGRWLGAVQRGREVQLLEVTPAMEYRTLVNEAEVGEGDYTIADLNPFEDLLAINMGSSGVHIWSIDSGRKVAVLPSGVPLIQPDGKEILIGNKEGLHRYPIMKKQFSVEKGIEFGQPQSMVLPATPNRTTRNQDGRCIAFLSESKDSVWLLDLNTESVRPGVLRHKGCTFLALSPDSKWIATSGWHSDQVRLWDAEKLELVQQWPSYQTSVFFTPDSKGLILGQREQFNYYDLKTQKLIYHVRRDVAFLPGYVAFVPNGNLMAMEMGPGIIHLKEITTGKTVAKLEDPNGDRSSWMGFTSDGCQLVVLSHSAMAVHVWNLRAIRERLKTMQLDWVWPDFVTKK